MQLATFTPLLDTSDAVTYVSGLFATIAAIGLGVVVFKIGKGWLARLGK